MATNSFPIAGARQFANRLIINMYQQWMTEFTSVERDMLCWLVATTVGDGEVSTQVHASQLVTFMPDVTTDAEKAEHYEAVKAAFGALVERGIVLAGEPDEQGNREVMVNLRWQPEA